MNLLQQRIFFKLVPPQGEMPTDTNDYKDWRNKQKHPLGKWKDDAKFTYAELESHPNVGMIIPEGYIVIDVDDKEQSEKIDKAINSLNLKCIKSQTGKGKHFIFKDPLNGNRTQSNGAITKIGVKIDSRVANKGYVAVKFLPDAEVIGTPDGNRFTTLIDLEQIDDLPHWLEPIKMQSSDKAQTICKNRWLEGNRDNDMMVWTNIIWNTDTDKKKEIYEIFGIINGFLMDKPLFTGDAEAKKKINGWLTHVENVKENTLIEIGDEEQEAAGFGLLEGKKDIDYVSLSQHIIALMKIAYYQGTYWIKKEDKPWYEKINDEEIFQKVVTHFGNVALKADDKKFFVALKTYSMKTEKGEDDYNLINFKNGRYDIKEGTLKPYDGSEFITFGIDVDYNPHTTPNQIDKALSEWTQGHQDEIDTLMEFVGSVMYGKNDFSRGIILYGPTANNGKSTFMEMMTSLFKQEYITSMNFSQLESRFGAFDLIGKRLIQIPELEDTYIERSAVFKQVVGSTDYIEVEGKNIRNKVRFLPNVKFIGATNRFPRFGDQTNGLWRRLIVIPFNFSPTKEQMKEFDKSALMNQEAKERLVFLAIEGLKRYLGKRRFTIPERSEQLEKRMQTIADGVRAHREDGDAPPYEGFETNLKLSELYQRYTNWCKQNGYKALGRNNYRKHIEDIYEDLFWEQSPGQPAYLRKKTKAIEQEQKEFLSSLQKGN